MALETPEKNQKVLSEQPDLHDPDLLRIWLNEKIKYPFLGYDSRKNPNGDPYTASEQVSATIDQVVSFVNNSIKQNHDINFVRDFVLEIAATCNEPRKN